MRNIFIDTDVGNDVDDVLAIAMAVSLAKSGHFNIRGIIVSNGSRLAPQYCKALLNLLGVNIDIYWNNNCYASDESRYLTQCLSNSATTTPPFEPKTIDDLYHDLKKEQNYTSLDYVCIGLWSTIWKLMILANADGLDLSDIVPNLVAMAGNFRDRRPEFNVMLDPAAFDGIINKYNGGITFCDYNVGGSLTFNCSLVENAVSSHNENLIVNSYLSFRVMPYDNPLWDPMTILAATQKYDFCFIKKYGRVTIKRPSNSTFFTEDSAGRHCVLSLKQGVSQLMRNEIAQRAFLEWL